MNDIDLISRIADRAMDMYPGIREKIQWMMDLETVHDKVELRLEELLNADDGNFGHDLAGIANNLNRATKKIENCFHPRYAN